MSELEYARLRDDFDVLGQRIQKRMQELKGDGRFPEDFERTASEIQEHRRRASDRVAEAIRSGSQWNILKTELMWDYESLSDNVLRFEQQIDEQFAENQKR